MAKPSMKGQINTPESIAQFMVTKLFFNKNPTRDHILLDPGCGNGTFIKAVLDWCRDNDYQCPKIVGIETDDRLLRNLRRLGLIRQNRKFIKLLERDFLLEELEIIPSSFDFIICNPPYVRLEHLSINERQNYRKKFETAVNRFDLYLLFFERALKFLKPSGRLVFLTPERFEYSVTAKALRRLMTNYHVEELHHMSEDTFKGIKTAPAITVISNTKKNNIRNQHHNPLYTQITCRDGLGHNNVILPSEGSSWLPAINPTSQNIMGGSNHYSGYRLGDVCSRISCGVATGFDDAFIIDKDEVPDRLNPYTCSTVGGRDLTKDGISISKRMLIPYDHKGRLLPITTAEKFRSISHWLYKYKERLAKRTCVTKKGKQWYSFHDTPSLRVIVRPKILYKDVTKEPQFWIDRTGEIVPRHSVYYIIPKESEMLSKLTRYLNSSFAKEWLWHNCPRAIDGYFRMQSTVLKKMPIPLELAASTSVIPSPKMRHAHLDKYQK